MNTKLMHGSREYWRRQQRDKSWVCLSWNIYHWRTEVYHSQKREEGRDKQNVDDGHVLNSTFLINP